MGIQTLFTAATGMTSLDTKLQVIANNMANVNTTAYKRDRCNFEDLFYQHEILPGSQNVQGNLTPAGIAIGLGTRIQSVQIDATQGSFKETGKQLDLAIAGKGFFQLTDPATGNFVYSRAGNFEINNNGQVVMGSASNGRLLEPNITVPQDATNIVIGPDGLVFVQQAGNTQLQQVGQIQLSQFINPNGLLKLGENLYQDTVSSGQAITGNPGQNGLGVIRQTFLEMSNVEPVDELIELITTQRAFELNSQTIQAADQVLQLVNNLRRV